MKPFAFVVVLAFVFVACRNAPPDVLGAGPVPQAVTVEQASSDGSSSVAYDDGGVPDTAPENERLCEPALVVPPSVLATRWPGLVGKRVRLSVRPLRAISFTQWLVVSRGQRFLVLAPPDMRWIGEHVFVVSGASVAPVRGRTALPELVLDDCSS